MRSSRRLEQIPPYLFAELERKISAKRAAGIDVISLGIGDPDMPTFEPIVAAAQRAVADPSTHGYPTNRGRQEFRDAVAALLRASLRRRARPRRRSDARDRRQGVHLQPQPRVPRPGRRRARVGPRLPGVHERAADRRRRAGAAAAEAGARLRPRPRCDPVRRARARADHVPQLPEQPDRRDRPRRAVRARGGARPRARDPRRARQRLQRDHLRRVRRAVVPADARAPRRSASRCSRSRRATT